MASLKWKFRAMIVRPGLETFSIGSGNKFFWFEAHAGHFEPLLIIGQSQSEVAARVAHIKGILDGNCLALKSLASTRIGISKAAVAKFTARSVLRLPLMRGGLWPLMAKTARGI